MDKYALLAEIIRELKAEHALLSTAAEMAHAEATDSESQARSKYDTHAQEAAYLAEGQAKIAVELAESLRIYQTMETRAFAPSEPIALGALVEVGVGNTRTLYFMGPRNGGLEVPLSGQTVLIVTPQSPLGRCLLGKKAGEAIELPVGAIPRVHQILTVH